jgi:hypothetical protein
VIKEIRRAAATSSSVASRKSLTTVQARRCGHARNSPNAQSTGPSSHHEAAIQFTGGRP